MEPELKKVSILFVDITNSVHLIHKLRPEGSTEYLEPTLNVLKQSAHRYGGMINRLDGDDMMVIFGAPIAYEDHAVRACYEALGPTVYWAHRMEVLASPNTAIISRETYRLAQKHIRALDAGPTQIKGLDQTVHVFQLQGRISQQSDQIPRLEQNLFVARFNELAQLESALALKPFSDTESMEYLRSILGRHASMERVRAEILKHCEGIPLYMEEMIHHLLDSNLIWGEQGDFQSSLDTLPESLPVTIHSVISTRIDRHSKMAKSILQAASVIGQRFSANLLDYITDIPREYARHAIDALIQAGLVNAIESLYKERLDEHICRLAEHAYLGQ